MEEKRIIILGARGMLGQMTYSYFTKNGFDVTTYNERFSNSSFNAYISDLNRRPDSLIINCIGKIKQKSESSDELFLANALFPLELSRSLKSSHTLIHPSTDCVFDGNSASPYLSFNKHTAIDIYGISKSLGETAALSMPNSLVIRVSIIGPDRNSNKGLLSWFLNNEEGAELQGYINHYWNGITTLEWCKKLHSMLEDQDRFEKLLKHGLIQLGTQEEYSKFEMLEIFQKTYQTNFKISSFEAKDAVYRCLNSEFVSKPLEMQILELREFDL